MVSTLNEPILIATTTLLSLLLLLLGNLAGIAVQPFASFIAVKAYTRRVQYNNMI